MAGTSTIERKKRAAQAATKRKPKSEPTDGGAARAPRAQSATARSTKPQSSAVRQQPQPPLKRKRTDEAETGLPRGRRAAAPTQAAQRPSRRSATAPVGSGDNAARRAAARTRVRTRIDQLAGELLELEEQEGLGGDVNARPDSLSSVWGPAPSRATREEAEKANTRKAFIARRAILSNTVTRKQAAELLGLSGQAVTKYLEQRRMIGLKDRGRWRIPLWQLDADTRDGYLDGIDRVADAFPGGVVALSQWVTKPAADFGGRAPRDLLAKDRVDEVVQAAKALTAKGW